MLRAVPPDPPGPLSETLPADSDLSDPARPPDAFARTVPTPGDGSRQEIPRGALLGRYVIVSCLGEGGMGIVYRAYDPELDRKVAVKLLRSNRFLGDDSSEGRARLVREGQAMARLAHPNVVAVYDVGTHEGQVFVAMELVDGGTLRTWLAAPRKWTEIVRMFMQAGQGLAAAHEAGIVHRDFKSDNVLVGKDGRARVLDFGLAHAGGELARPPESAGAARLEQSSSQLSTPLTEEGRILGTPRYMAPEQLTGERTDARADQFSFCVALFEALYGVPPFEGEVLAELYANVVAGKIRAVRATRGVPARLRQILARGLSVSAADRYPTMTKLLAELEPERERRRLVAGLAGAAALLVSAAAVGMVRSSHSPCRGLERGLAGAWDPAKKAAVRAAFIASGKVDAADTADRVADRLDRYAGAWLRTRVDACEATHVRGDQSEHLLDLRVACLDRRLHELASLTDIFSAKPDGQIVEKSVNATSQLTTLDACSDATALQSVVPPPDDAAQRAKVEQLRGQLAEARTLENTAKYDGALSVAREVDDASAAIDYAPLRAEALYRLGSIEAKKNDSKSAEKHFQSALEFAARGHDDALTARIWPALIIDVGQDQARYADATLLIPVAESAVHRADDDEARAALYDVQGRMLGAHGKDADAQRMFEASLALRQKTLPPDDPALANSLNNLGIAYDKQAKYKEALDAYERALAIREKAFGPDHPVVAVTLSNIAIVYKEEGKYAEARAQFERAIAIKEKTLGPDNPQLANTIDSLANVYDQEGNREEAQRLHERGLEIREKALGPDHPDVAISLNNLAGTLVAEGKYDEAQRMHERALAIREKVLGPDNQMVGVTIENLADILVARSKFAEAEGQYRRALAIFEKTEGPTHPDVCFPLVGLTDVLERLGHHAEAVTDGERALRLREANPTPPHDMGYARFALAKALWGAGGDRGRAVALAKQARDDFAASGRTDPHAEVERWLKDHGS
jgi:eukaryotic-like serine/threonine-protein kinase